MRVWGWLISIQDCFTARLRFNINSVNNSRRYEQIPNHVKSSCIEGKNNYQKMARLFWYECQITVNWRWLKKKSMLFALTRFLECIFVSAVKFPIYPIYRPCIGNVWNITEIIRSGKIGEEQMIQHPKNKRTKNNYKALQENSIVDLAGIWNFNITVDGFMVGR